MIFTGVRDIVRNENPGKKMVLYAHSMGGAIGALVLEQYPELFDCAVLTSPMLKMKFNILKSNEKMVS